MMADTLSKQQIADCKSGLYACRQAEMEIEKCRSCGLDVSEQEARKEHLKAFLTAVLENYGSPIQKQQ